MDAQGNGNSAPTTFLEAFARRLGSGGRGVAGGGDPGSRVFRVSAPTFAHASRAPSGKRKGADGCACDGKRRVSSLRK